MTLPPRTHGDVRSLEDGPEHRRKLVDQYDAALVELAVLHDREVETAKAVTAAATEHREARDAYDRKVLRVRELRRAIILATPEPPLVADVEQQNAQAGS